MKSTRNWRKKHLGGRNWREVQQVREPQFVAVDYEAVLREGSAGGGDGGGGDGGEGGLSFAHVQEALHGGVRCCVI